MSRGFVKEEDQEEAPMIPPRAALPDGAINYVTPLRMQQLLDERALLETQKLELSPDDETEHRRDTAVLNGKLNLLQERIISARILDPADQAKDVVRFGAKVTYKMLANKKIHTFQIVGVDEADIKKDKIAFVAPIAVAITGSKVCDIVDFQLGKEIRKIEILEIRY